MSEELVLPQIRALMGPTLQVMREAGTPMSTTQIEAAISNLLNLTPDERTWLHRRGGRTEIGYRAAWARTQLREDGLIERAGFATWRLTERGRTADQALDAAKGTTSGS